MSKDINELLEFVKFTHEIRNVRRAVLLETTERQENDAEHMYQMALVAWFLIDNDNLLLDRYKCIGMSMVHDISEAYAGDTIAFASPEELEAQKLKEEEAIEKLQQKWPGFTSLHELIKEYEDHTTPEGRFVYALDKLMPIINNYLYEGKVWHKEGITIERMKSIKEGKVDISPEINQYYESLLKILEAHPEVFPKTF